jgi:hypothetical protein
VRAGYLWIVSIFIPDYTGFIPNISVAEVQTRLPGIFSFCGRLTGDLGIGPHAFQAVPEGYRVFEGILWGKYLECLTEKL